MPTKKPQAAASQINSQHADASEVVITEALPSRQQLERATGARHLVLVYDERLADHDFFAAWLSDFSNKIGVEAGENLKSIDYLPNFARSILPLLSGYSASECALVAVGGGSVGDFVGFLASVIKRGIGLAHIPTTWLSAVDSAYGGKTALNVGTAKNQVGTFYSASAVFCSSQVLALQPAENLRSGYGEAIKMALIAGGSIYEKLKSADKLDEALMARLLPELVDAKMKIVKQDPFEKTGARAVLNLGHTLGHSLELEHNLAHGLAVQVGTEFAVRWSFERKLMKETDRDEILALLAKNPLPRVPKVSRAGLTLRLAQDKKSVAGGQVRFVFLKKPGQPVLEDVRIAEILVASDLMGLSE